MGHVLKLNFEDFKEVVDDKRIYFFEGEDFVDFHIIHNSIIVKSTVQKSDIENPDKFFSNQIFSGAKRLEFNIPDGSEETDEDEDDISDKPNVVFKNEKNQEES